MEQQLPVDGDPTQSTTTPKEGRFHNYIREAVLEYEAEHLHGKPSYRHRTPLRYNIKIQDDDTHIILVAGSNHSPQQQDHFHNYVREAVLKYESEDNRAKSTHRHQTPATYNVKIQNDDPHTVLIAGNQQSQP